jgi:hypothetical protein
MSLTRAAFDVLEVPLAAGRWASDDLQAGEALVNETLAGRLSPVSSVLGQSFTLSFNRRTYVITGIVRDAHLTAFDRVDPMVFIPPVSGFPVLLATTTPDAERQLAALVESVDPDLEVTFAPLSESAQAALATARAGAAIAGSLGVVALLLESSGARSAFVWRSEDRAGRLPPRSREPAAERSWAAWPPVWSYPCWLALRCGTSCSACTLWIRSATPRSPCCSLRPRSSRQCCRSVARCAWIRP